MGQFTSRRLTDDTLSLFHPISDDYSVISITNDDSRRRLDDLVNNYQDQHKSKKYHKLSLLRRCICNCFRSNFTELHEVDSDTDNEILNVPSSRDHKPMSYENTADLPRDVREVQDQLILLMQLLTRSDHDSTGLNTRDVACQTGNNEMKIERLVRQMDSVIIEQQEKINSLYQEIDNRNQTIEMYTKEHTILKASQSRHRLDTRRTLELITFLNDLKKKEQHALSDRARIDEVIELIKSVLQPQKHLTENSNVAIISPCSNLNSERCASSSTSNFPPISSDLKSSTFSLNPFIRHNTEMEDCNATKLICFLDYSVTPYISAIPHSLSPITLSHIKDCTKSILPPNKNCHYFFRFTTADCGQTQEEIYQDTDMVPVHNNKIIVRIRV